MLAAYILKCVISVTRTRILTSCIQKKTVYSTSWLNQRWSVQLRRNEDARACTWKLNLFNIHNSKLSTEYQKKWFRFPDNMPSNINKLYNNILYSHGLCGYINLKSKDTSFRTSLLLTEDSSHISNNDQIKWKKQVLLKNFPVS